MNIEPVGRRLGVTYCWSRGWLEVWAFRRWWRVFAWPPRHTDADER